MNIAEIAKLAGVSSAAVSRYFNHGYISEEKKESIRKVVEQTGYRPSMQAQTLRTKKTRLIGVILPRIDSASISSMIAGILSVYNVSGYHLLLTDTQNDPAKELESLSIFNEKQVDGVILIATVFTAAHRKLLKNMSVPVVLIGQSLPGSNCVCHDDYHATYELTEMFLNKGRKRLGFISVFHQDQAAGAERFRGYCDAVKHKGAADLAENYVVSDGFTLDSGFQAARNLLERRGMVDGIICATDTLAVGALQYLKSREILVPDQVWLAGHGDSSLSGVTTPTVTTVHYSYEECGMLAGQMLMELLEKGKMAAKEVRLGCQVVVKGSGGGEGVRNG